MDKRLLSRFEITAHLSYVILALLVALISLINFIFIMRPQLKTLVSLEKKIAESSKAVKETKNNLERLPVLEQEAATLKQQLSKVQNSVLPREEAIVAIDKISRLAIGSGIKVNQITPMTNAEAKVLSNDQGDYFSFPIVLGAEGGYHDIGRFFNNVESDETFMSIDHFEIIRNPVALKKCSVTATINIFVMKKK